MELLAQNYAKRMRVNTGKLDYNPAHKLHTKCLILKVSSVISPCPYLLYDDLQSFAVDVCQSGGN